MWSKRKPVRDSRNFPPFSDVGRANDTWGLDIPGYAWGNDDNQIWTYQRPRGDAYDEPYRIGDFRNYFHNAVNPVLLPSAPNELNEQFNVTAITTESTDTNLGLGDFYQDLRLGLEVRDENNDIIDWASAASATGGVDVDLTGYLNTNTVSIHFFVVDTYKEWGEPSVPHTKYTVPRANTSENPHWYNIPVVSSSYDDSDIEQYDVMWNDSNNELTINIDTVSYTGDAKVVISEHSTGNGVTTVTFNIPNTNLYTHTETNSSLQPSTEYDCKLYLYNSTNSEYDYIETFTFMTFGQM